MNIRATIEKGKDGLYAVRSEAKIGDSYMGGFGESVEEAKEDFLESVEDALEEAGMQGVDVKVSYNYDLPSFFNYFDFINVSKFSSLVGVNESKMRQYKSGLAHPGEKTAKKIILAVHKIGNELINSTI